MSTGFKIKFDPASVTQTKAALNRVKKYATGGAWNMLNKLTLFFIRSAIAATPTAKKKREIFTARTPAEIRALGWRFAVKFPYGTTARAERMGGPVEGHWIGTNSINIANDMAEITYWGAAKASWGGMFAKMGVLTWASTNSALSRVTKTANWIKFIRNPEKQSIVTVNKLTYLNAIGGTTIQQTALAKAKGSFEHQQKRAMSAGMELAWRGRAAA
jgi:hypothetical protein